MPPWDLTLVAGQDLLKLTRDTNRLFGPPIELIFPEIPIETLDALILQIFIAKPCDPNEVFKDFSMVKRPATRYYQSLQTNEDGEPILLEYTKPNSVEGSTDTAIAERAVINNRFGVVTQPIDGLYSLGLCSQSPPEGNFVRSSPETVLSLSEPFKNLAIKVANLFGGAQQISSPIYEGKLVPLDKLTSKNSILTRWMLLGYKATAALIVTGSNESDIAIGTRSSRHGKDTVAGRPVPISINPIFKPEWAFWRGLQPKGRASLGDVNTLAPR